MAQVITYHQKQEVDSRQCHSYFQYEEKVECRVPAWDGEGGLAANPAHPSLGASRRPEEEAELQPRPGGSSCINAGIPATHPHFKVTRNISAETGTSGGPQTPPQCDDGNQADYSETSSTKRQWQRQHRQLPCQHPVLRYSNEKISL